MRAPAVGVIMRGLRFLIGFRLDLVCCFLAGSGTASCMAAAVENLDVVSSTLLLDCNRKDWGERMEGTAIGAAAILF